MSKKALIPIGLTVLSLLTAVGFLDICDCTRLGNQTVAAADDTSKPAVGAVKTIAYYFHGTSRCTTCRTIEAYAHEAVQTGFGDALNAGKLEWRALNVEEPANRHFIKDYQLYTRSVVLASYQGDKPLKWKNLDKVWELVGDKGQFTRYVQGEVKTFLESQ
jgi:hypothetical protein